MMNPWIQTRDGRALDLLEPDYSAVSLCEFVHALARINRWTGHTRTSGGYSVGQHCVLVARNVRYGLGARALTHDFHEIGISDVTSPVKRALAALGGGEAFRELDRRHMDAVSRRFALPIGPMPPEVHEADLRALVTERRDLLGDVEAKPWGLGPLVPFTERIRPWSIERTEEALFQAIRALLPEAK